MEVPTSLLNKYIQRRVEDLSECQHFLKAREFKEIEKIGHQLKGNGATFGFPEVSEIGSTLERSAAKSDSREIEQALNAFSDWLSTPH